MPHLTDKAASFARTETEEGTVGEQWRPIETAPKDGRLILAITPAANEWSGYFAAYWDANVDEWRYSRDAVVRGLAFWMPLPTSSSPLSAKTRS